MNNSSPNAFLLTFTASCLEAVMERMMGCLFNNTSFPSFPASRFEECEGVVREQDFNTRRML